MGAVQCGKVQCSSAGPGATSGRAELPAPDVRRLAGFCSALHCTAMGRVGCVRLSLVCDSEPAIAQVGALARSRSTGGS